MSSSRPLQLGRLQSPISDKSPYEADSERSSEDLESSPFELAESRPPFGHLSQTWRRLFFANPTRRFSSPRTRSPSFDDGMIVKRRGWCSQKTSRRPRVGKLVLYFFAIYLMVLGILETANETWDLLATIYPDEVQWVVDHWGQPHDITENLGRWATDSTRAARPISCSSQNDYWQPVPLFSAIQAGCTSVEIDVWLFDNELYVGHTTSALTDERTLRSLYLDPLATLLAKQNPVTRFAPAGTALNGIFDTIPSQSLVLLIDFESIDTLMWPTLNMQLQPLREAGYLTHFNGSDLLQRPITIVVSGNVPFDLLAASMTYRDIFYDAPLDRMADDSAAWPNPNRIPEEQKPANNALVFQGGLPGLRPDFRLDESTETLKTAAALYNSNNSYYASASFTQSLGYVWGSRLSQAQLQLIRSQIRGAHERGLKARYWDLPYWPTGLRNHIWHILIREGADMLSVDDLIGMTRRDWRRVKGWSH